jgi:DNA-binding beta-propeller fold protein YncE
MPLRQWLIGACLGLMAVTGCKDEEKPPTQSLGNGTIGNIKAAAHDEAAFTAPLDATPNPDGSKVYFTARNADGAGVFTASASGGGTTALHVGDPIAGPVGITVSSDDRTVFVADPGATVNEDDQGAIWSVPTEGGLPTAVSGTEGYSPNGIVLVNENGTDLLYFTGRVPGDLTPGVFRVPATGGTVEGLAKGEPFSDPNGIAVTARGEIYVLDSAAGDLTVGSARVIQVVDQTAQVFQDGLKVGFPAGIALAQDDSAVLLSALDPATSTDTVVRIDLASKAQTAMSDGIDTYEEAAGLHRAANAEVYAWADSSADGSGTVYVLTP